ncbi:MAG: molecular chaperone HtpG [Verrucomicrobia bacterium]|nr:molecular chaperone HtpG [Verrucomicrobiota bacterium]
MSKSEKHEFQAEIAQLLEIVIHSLYTEKEIFIRELISNAADANEKLQFLQQTAGNDIFEPERPLAIRVSTDDTAKTVTITDSGIGMTQAELVENLGTIAHSGSKAFLEQIKQAKGDAHLIGQFGVGFYSAFMVADSVTVYTRSYRTDAQGWKWTSDGKTGYEIEPADDLERGTKIVLHLRETEYSEGYKVESIIKRYSNFVSFPIELNGKPVNTIQPLWTKNRSEIKEDDYTEFYKYIGHDTDAPQYRLHFNADAPLSIKAILFVPERSTELLTMSRQEGEVHLYCKRVLITAKAKGLFPEWLRFLKGVVDSEDLPLNISRETMQDSALLRKINEVLTKRVLKWLDEEAQADPAKFAKFFAQHGHCLKEGVATDWSHREAIAKLLRFKSSLTEGEALTSLAEYIARMPEGQKEIYFLHAPDREAAEASPDFEAFRAKNWEVIFLEDPRDEFVLEHLHSFDGKNLVATAKADITLDRPVDRSKSLSEEQAAGLVEFLKSTFADRVTEVRSSQRLVGSPAAVREPEGAMNASMRRMMKMMGQDAPEMAVPKPDFEINPDHAVIVGVERLRHKDEALAKQVAAQLLDNAMVAAGLIEDPRAVLGRLNQLLEKLLPNA